MLVMKFGGTSVGTAEAIQRVGAIITERRDASPVVVVSAIGHMTDLLVEVGRYAAQRDRKQSFALILTFLSQHRNLLRQLGLADQNDLLAILTESEGQLKQLSEAILQSGHLSRHLSDELLALGEFFSANILSRYLTSIGLPSRMVDSRKVLITDAQFGKAQPQMVPSTRQIKKELLPLLERQMVPVLQGFVGADELGRTTTLGRGGSDFSATLFAAMLEADGVEIWTDVDGVLTADPSLVVDAKRIQLMTFQEAAELAYFGARVLHPASLLPAVDKNIPIAVRNSMRPQERGTLIVPESAVTNGARCVVKSIAYKEDITMITVISTRMLMAYGFLSSIFEVFSRYQTAVDLVTTSEVSVSITIDQTDRLAEIKRDLSRFAHVEVQGDKAIVCLVGERMRQTPGMPAEIFSVLHDIPIHLISQGASEMNISFVIDANQLPTVIHTLHDRFFSGPLDPEIFSIP